MQADFDKQTSLAVFDEMIRRLPPSMAKDVVANRSDPKPLKKGNTEVMRIRVLPRTKSPIRFWDTAWCFYEIGVGFYSTRGGGKG